jgi:hypothetical protein
MGNLGGQKRNPGGQKRNQAVRCTAEGMPCSQSLCHSVWLPNAEAPHERVLPQELRLLPNQVSRLLTARKAPESGLRISHTTFCALGTPSRYLAPHAHNARGDTASKTSYLPALDPPHPTPPSTHTHTHRHPHLEVVCHHGRAAADLLQNAPLLRAGDAGQRDLPVLLLPAAGGRAAWPRGPCYSNNEGRAGRGGAGQVRDC